MDNDPRRPHGDEPLVRIVSAMPKPIGDDGHNKEWVTIQNLGDGSVDLADLTLSDDNGSVNLGTLKDSLEYGESLAVHHENLGGMMLSNAGESISLTKTHETGNDVIVHQVRYGNPERGRAFLFG